MVGSRELDPVKVGFKSNPDDYHGAVPGSLFDTSLPGNSNAGHDYGTRGFVGRTIARIWWSI
jgi:hypothetical protein